MKQEQIYKDSAALNEMPGVSPGRPLGLPEDATTVHVARGKTVTRNGQYLSEGVGGYLVLEADDLAAAIELAVPHPGGPFTAARSKYAQSRPTGE